MSTGTVTGARLLTGRRTSARASGALFVGGGILTAVGGKLHPVGSGDDVPGHLLTMFASPAWPLAHLLLLAGTVLGVTAILSAWRGRLFGAQVQPWLVVAALGWTFGAVELVPHLLAAREAHALAHHQATPVLDVHLVMQVVASPAVGLTGAALATAIARASRSRTAWVLAGFAVVGGVLSGAAAPLVVLTGNPVFTVLFPLQAGLSVWLLGTGVRLWRR
jgi:hypothetical protein